jgi:hypothetical protein
LNCFARSSQMPQVLASALKPPVVVAPSESSDSPNSPAARAPAGETWFATAISTPCSV